MILGETGSGKELVARALHDAGPRHGKPFVPVDCAALMPSLIEAELFGHVQGAFTGAFADRIGPLAAARNGTVFLDEIGELPLELQSRLLRAIQEKTVRPLGSNDSARLEARFVVATNKNLLQSVTNGTFRSDLYFRLAVGRIIVPPLRERQTDVPFLAEAFLEEANQSVRTTRVISDAAMRKLIRHSWPGNVRELKNVIHRAVLLSDDRVIGTQDIPTEITDMDLSWNFSKADIPPKTEESFNIAELESKTIRRALSKARGDKILAAKMLGIGKTTLYRKLKRLEHDEVKALQSVS